MSASLEYTVNSWHLLETTEGIYIHGITCHNFQYAHPHIQASVKIRHIDAL